MVKILYAEDSVSIARHVMQTFLKDKFEVVLSPDGEEAFTEFEKSKFDLVLTDLMMPKLDGVELITKIREIDEKIPIICITGAKDSIVDKAMAAGANYKIIKPHDFILLPNLINKFY